MSTNSAGIGNNTSDTTAEDNFCEDHRATDTDTNTMQ
jgi:hypothetical protein